jgi:hypothetical protein
MSQSPAAKVVVTANSIMPMAEYLRIFAVYSAE